ncbi:MAG: DUF2079 domain-containing protein [Acidobacteriota bacterium]|nr:DUF2079 domain-containing protein [Acidobacteriota bacterium]
MSRLSHHQNLLTAIMIAAFAVFSILNMFRAYFDFSIYSGDYTIFEQAFYNTTRGQWFRTTFEGGNHLGVHFSPILFLFVPLMAVAKSLTVLIAVHICLTAYAIWLLYRHNREAGFGDVGLVIVTMFLFHSTITHNTRIFYELSLLPLPFVGAFISYEKERFRSFMVQLFVIACIRENLFVLIGSWGLLAFSFGRRGPWVWGPLTLAGLHFAIANLIIPPMFDHTLQVGLLSFYKGYGHTPAEILANLQKDPLLPLRFLFKESKFDYLTGILIPFLLVLPFFRRWWLPALPTLVFILFSTGHRVIVPTYHYSLEIILWLGISTLILLRDKPDFFKRTGVKRFLAVLPLLVTANYVYRGGDALVRLHAGLNSERLAQFRTISAQIPLEAPVLAEYRFCNHMARRDHIYFLHMKNEESLKQPVDYALIEGELPFPIPESWRPTSESGPFTLYRVGGPP